LNIRLLILDVPLRTGRFSFFEDDNMEKDIKKISLPSKLFFAKCYYGFNYYWKPIDEMIKIRNHSSHRGEKTFNKEQEILHNAKKNVAQKKAEYFKEFDKVIKKLKDLFYSE